MPTHECLFFKHECNKLGVLTLREKNYHKCWTVFKVTTQSPVIPPAAIPQWSPSAQLGWRALKVTIDPHSDSPSGQLGRRALEVISVIPQ